ncbi:MAG TPA: energy transducer TonB [Candidatus Polarisedimenticolia bacterium]
MSPSPAVLLLLALIALLAGGEVTPGSLGLLIQQPDERTTAVALAGALQHSSPEIRGAAARVANVIGASGLLPDLRKTLQTETNPNAAREQMRALVSLGAPEEDLLLIEAANRLGGKMGPIAGEILARSRGTAAIPLYFSGLDHAGFTGEERVSIFRLACRSRPEAIDAAAAAALAAGEPDDWVAILRVGAEVDHLPPVSALVLAIGHPSSRFRSGTAWLLLESFAARVPSMRGDLLAAVETASMDGTVDAGSDLYESIGPVLLTRLLGRPPVESPSLLAALGWSRPGRIDRIAGARWLNANLTPSEREALGRRLRLFPAAKPTESFAQPRSAAGSARYPSGLPKGFASDVLEAAGCVPEDIPGVVRARVRFDDPGRPVEVTLEDSTVALACKLAASLIFKASIDTEGDFSDQAREATFLLILDSDLVSLMDEPEIADSPAHLDDDGGTITPPVRIRFVAPVYPERLRLIRRSGTVTIALVVDRKGAPRQLRIIESNQEAFSTAAIHAVSQWRYRPALRNEAPVPVFLTVKVDFRMN